jgi:hypothetical protein
MTTGISETKIMSTISDEHSLNLFRTIALAKNDNGVALTSKTKELTRKQYYSRMSRMIKIGLVKRKNGKYSLTSLGKVVHESGRIIEEALKEYWKLRAIDSIQTFDRTVLPHEERKKIIDTLFNDNEKIKEVILCEKQQEHRYTNDKKDT